MAASPNPHGHDPATTRPRAVAGACPPNASGNAVTIHTLHLSSAVPKPAGISPAAVTPVTAAGHSHAHANNNRRPSAKCTDRNFILLTTMAIAAMMLIVLTAASYAQTRPLALPAMKIDGKAEPRIGGAKSNPCVAVDIAGHKAGDAECAAQKLQDAAKQAQDRAKDQPAPNVASATSPDTEIGVANEAATKQRLGDNFGKSVLPQRPTLPPSAPSPFARQ